MEVSERPEAFLARLLAHDHARVAAVDKRGSFIPAPAGLAQLLQDSGHTHDALAGRTGFDIVVPEDRAAVLDAWDRAHRSGAASLSARLAAAPTDGAWEMHLLDVFESFGAFVVVCIPTSEVARPHVGLTLAPPARPRLVRVLKDGTGTFTAVDAAILELLGWPEHEMLGRRSTEFIHPDDQQVAIDSWNEMLASPGLGRRQRLRHRRQDGSWAWFELTNDNRLETEGCVSCEMLDISEEMETHEALRAREQLLDRLTDALPVGVVQIDDVGAVVFANREAFELLGLECGDVEQLTQRAKDADRGVLRACFGRVLAGADACSVEVSLASAAAGETLVQLSVEVRRLDDAGRTTGAIACLHDISDSVRLRRQLEHQASRDPLTRLLNRTALLDSLEQALATPETGVAAIFVDLDGFKEVNDRYGHATGDAALCHVARLLRRGCRDTDVVGRLGGDEFLVICAPVASAAAAAALAERFAGDLREPAGELPKLAASFGVAWTDNGNLTAPQLVAAADAAMYEAKASRERRVIIAPSLE